MALDRLRARQVLDAVHGVAALVATTTPLRCRLMTTAGSADTPGTELASGGGYTAGAGAPAVTFSAADASASSTASVTVTNMPATTVRGVETWDSSATPRRQEFGTITDKTLAAGDSLTVNLTATLV